MSSKESKIKAKDNKSIIKNINGIEVIIEDVKVSKVSNKEIILDEGLIEARVKGIIEAVYRTKSKYNPMPVQIVIKNEKKELEKKHFKEDENLYELIDPKWGLNKIYIEEKNRTIIETTLSISKYKRKLFDEWGIKGNSNGGKAICLNFYGQAGTGKSVTAEAIAKELDKKILKVNYSELESKYVGETPKNIKRVFKIAEEQELVIVFDEADSFLGKRLQNVTQSADYGVNITRSVMLLELEKFNGVVIFTTNLIKNYDEAFKRRILASIEFKLPDIRGRYEIWKNHLNDKIPLNSEVTIKRLAKEISSVSGADIKDIILFSAVRALEKENDQIQMEDFIESAKIIKQRYRVNNEKVIELKTEKISEEEYKREVIEDKYD